MQFFAMGGGRTDISLNYSQSLIVDGDPGLAGTESSSVEDFIDFIDGC